MGTLLLALGRDERDGGGHACHCQARGHGCDLVGYAEPSASQAADVAPTPTHARACAHTLTTLHKHTCARAQGRRRGTQRPVPHATGSEHQQQQQQPPGGGSGGDAGGEDNKLATAREQEEAELVEAIIFEEVRVAGKTREAFSETEACRGGEEAITSFSKELRVFPKR